METNRRAQCWTHYELVCVYVCVCGGGLRPCDPCTLPAGHEGGHHVKYHTHAPAPNRWKSLLADSKQTCSSVIDEKSQSTVVIRTQKPINNME